MFLIYMVNFCCKTLFFTIKDVTIYMDYKKSKCFEKALDQFDMTEEEYDAIDYTHHDIFSYMNSKLYGSFGYKLHNDFHTCSESTANFIIVTYNELVLFGKGKDVYNGLCEEEWIIEMRFK